MRQKDDVVFANMLNRLRVKRKKEPLEESDIKLLESRTVQPDILTAPPDALHLFYLNKDVDNHNEAKLATLETDVYTIKAEEESIIVLKWLDFDLEDRDCSFDYVQVYLA